MLKQTVTDAITLGRSGYRNEGLMRLQIGLENAEDRVGRVCGYDEGLIKEYRQARELYEREFRVRFLEAR